MSIHFNDSKTETFEYPSEEYALEKYLQEHPNETAEILIFDTGSGDNGESSDDVGDDMMQTPRSNEDEVLRSNTALSHTGNKGLSYILVCLIQIKGLSYTLVYLIQVKGLSNIVCLIQVLRGCYTYWSVLYR